MKEELAREILLSDNLLLSNDAFVDELVTDKNLGELFRDMITFDTFERSRDQSISDIERQANALNNFIVACQASMEKQEWFKRELSEMTED